MNGLIKRMCILKQLKTGFSADGNALSGVVRVERYGKLSTLQLSLINFAPLSEGRYVCVLCDKQGERLIFPLTPQVSEYRTDQSDFNPEKGFCAVVCFVKTGLAECLAAGQYGSGGYNLKLLLEGVALPEKSEKKEPAVSELPLPKPLPEPLPQTLPDPLPEILPPPPPVREKKIEILKAQKYDDEAISQSDYYSQEQEHEQGNFASDIQDENAFTKSPTKEPQGSDATENDQAEKLLHPFKICNGQSYYLKIKDELETLFSSHERIPDLTAALPNSEWVCVDDAGGCLVGIIYENLQVRYLAYALPAQGKTPPDELKGACFIPVNPLSSESDGYFVLFQDADTGECVQVEEM